MKRLWADFIGWCTRINNGVQPSRAERRRWAKQTEGNDGSGS